MSSLNIYVRSYNRYDNIQTGKLVDYCTYVVRKSQEDKYKAAGVKTLGVEDDQISGGAKVLNWLIENAPEDVIVVLDDDIKRFKYRLDNFYPIEDTTVATQELERMAQLVYDLDIAYATVAGHTNLKYYDRPFKFVGVNAGVKVFNRRKVKGRFDQSIRFLYDDDFQMQELLHNRIVLLSEYFLVDSYLDTNKGGANDNKSADEWWFNHEEMCRRWGKYYIPPTGDSGSGRLNVKR